MKIGLLECLEIMGCCRLAKYFFENMGRSQREFKKTFKEEMKALAL